MNERVVACDRCPELRDYCREIGRTKRKAYRNDDYWARPVPGFGDPDARIVLIGLAPAAHGANRTGRVFTGDRSGDFLFTALHRAGLANQPTSEHRDDGLELSGIFITASLRCAPPKNKPTSAQLKHCRPFLLEELSILRPRVLFCLGSIGWDTTLRVLREAGHEIPKPKPKFAHGAECRIGPHTLLGCYHVSQQNTFTGVLTGPMIDAVLRRATAIAHEA